MLIHALLLTFGSFVGRTAKISAVFYDGNSITEGWRCENTPPYSSFIKLNGIPAANVAVGGATTPQQDARAASAIDEYAGGLSGERWVVMWEGGNDLFYGATPKQAIENLRAYTAHRRSAGFKVMLITIPPRPARDVPAGFEAQRQQVNAWLRGHWTETADDLIDLSQALPRLDDPRTASGPDNLCDGVHLGLEGTKAVAGAVGAALARHNGGPF